MKRRGWIYLMLFIVIQVLKSLVAKEFISDYGEGRIEVKIDEDSLIDYETLAFNEGYAQIQPAVLSRHTYSIKGKIETEVLGIGTNSYFKQVEPLKMNNGTFFGVQAVREGRNVVVISDQLAMKLFGSDKGTGNRCTIDDTTYQVVGVYKKYRGLGDVFLDDGRERIYFPITSKAAKNLKIEALISSSKNRETDLSVNQLQEMQINSGNSFVYNALDAGKKLKTLIRLPLNVLLLLIVSDMIKVVIDFLKQQTGSLRNKVMAVMLSMVGTYFALSIGMQPIYMPPEALPPYNIFDISFYIKYFRGQCMVYNYMLELHLSNYIRTYALTRNSIVLLSILQIVCCFRIKMGKEIFLKEEKE